MPELPAAPANGVAIGLTDVPARQAREPFVFNLVRAGHWAAAGGPRSGRTTAG